MIRHDGRSNVQMRPVRFIPNYTKNADGSVLVEFGETKVLCTVCIESGVPSFLRNASPAQGWLTAEYAMLPGATSGGRARRERPSPSGRSHEIQRLIGRSLRGIIDLTLCPDITFSVDCDVIQADGGTRTASITGSFIALKIAVDKLLRKGTLRNNPILDAVAAVSIGLKDGELLIDPDYEEDFTADLDMNVVMTQSGKILEIQGTAERAGVAFSKEDVTRIVEAAETTLQPYFELQQAAADGQEVEG
ncbi:MAG: ribonuclease PH [Oligoflexales bacterium]|nr:ribonuclease PH [Oligoflexales bacterium]